MVKTGFENSKFLLLKIAFNNFPNHGRIIKFYEISKKIFTIRPSIAFILRVIIIVMNSNECVIDQLLSSLDA